MVSPDIWQSFAATCVRQGTGIITILARGLRCRPKIRGHTEDFKPNSLHTMMAGGQKGSTRSSRGGRPTPAASSAGTENGALLMALEEQPLVGATAAGSQGAQSRRDASERPSAPDGGGAQPDGAAHGAHGAEMEDEDGMGMDLSVSSSGGGARRKRKAGKKTPVKVMAAQDAARAREEYLEQIDLLAPAVTLPDPDVFRTPTLAEPQTEASKEALRLFDNAMKLWAIQVRDIYILPMEMVQTGEKFNSNNPEHTSRAGVGKLRAGNALAATRYFVGTGPNWWFRRHGGTKKTTADGTKRPPWVPLMMQMAFSHVGVDHIKTVMNTHLATLNVMPPDLLFGSERSPGRTQWWVYLVAAMYETDALGKVLILSV